MGWLTWLRPTADTARRAPSALSAATHKHPGPIGRTVLQVGLDGRGPFRSAQRIADAALHASHDNPEQAVEKLVRDHIARSAIGGFSTGVGGYATLPLALPLNLAEFYIVATRMVGAIAVVRGYDVSRPEIRAAVLLTLVASRSDDALTKQGVGVGWWSRLGLRRLPPGALMLVNKVMFFRLLRRASRTMFPRLGRGLPLIRGGTGALTDSWMMARMAGQALVEFPPRDTGQDQPDTDPERSGAEGRDETIPPWFGEAISGLRRGERWWRRAIDAATGQPPQTGVGPWRPKSG